MNIISSYNALLSQIYYKKQLLIQKIHQSNSINLLNSNNELEIVKLKKEINDIKEDIKKEERNQSTDLVSKIKKSNNTTLFKFKETQSKNSKILLK